MTEPLLLRVEQAAKLLQLGRNAVYALVAKGEIPSLRIGRQLRIPDQELRDWIHEQALGERRR